MSDIQSPEDRIDPNVSLPPAIRAQAERAQQMFDAVNNPTPEGNVQQEQAEQQPGSEQQMQPGNEQSQPPPAPVPDETWEQRYNGMLGRWRKANDDNRQLADLNRQMTADNADLRNRLAGLEQLVSTLRAAPPAPVPSEQRASSLITPQEREEYGDDLINLIEKKAKEVAAAQTGRLQQEVERLQNQLHATGSLAVKSAREQMYASMDAVEPRWRELNTNERFLTWLQLQDPFSGVIRQELLKRAFEQNDTPRVLNFFKGFLAQEAAVDPAGQKPNPGAQVPPKVDLQNLAAPGRAKSAAAGNAPTEKPVYKQSDISAFYAAVTSGMFRGREAERDAREKDIFLAQAEGRVIPG